MGKKKLIQGGVRQGSPIKRSGTGGISGFVRIFSKGWARWGKKNANRAFQGREAPAPSPEGRPPRARGQAFILGGGEILNYAAVRAQLRDVGLILCADSGYLHCEKLGIKPDLLVGDFDSIGLIPAGVPRVVYPAEKDYTDSTIAIRAAARRGYRRILMAGMLGARLDHTWGNLQNLAWCVNRGIAAKITDGETEVFAVKDGTVTIPARENAYFSVFPLGDAGAGVTVLNAKYPLYAYPLYADDARAVSNEFCGRDVKVTVRSGAVAVVATPKRPAPRKGKQIFYP